MIEEPTIQHEPWCSGLHDRRYELFAGVLVSRCTGCDRGVPHPRKLSSADVKDRTEEET